MGIVKNITDFFRGHNEGTTKPIDRYGILSPLMATSEYVKAAKDYYKVLVSGNQVTQLLGGRIKGADIDQDKAIEAYKIYVKALPAHEQAMEKQSPLSTVLITLDTVSGNLELIEDHFQDLFGSLTEGGDEAVVRSSALVVIGYLETADIFTTWLGQLSAHLVPEEIDTIPPYWTKGLLVNAKVAGEFVANNLNKWSPRYKGLLEEIKQMQRKGVDVSVKTGDNWMDEFVHDNQFSHTEQELMTAALRNPILMIASGNLARHQEKIELLTSRKDWLISKVALEEARLSGLDANSPEYKRLKKATDHYAALVTKYEQKIERMRA